MAQKKITDLTLRSDFDETCNVPVDDATQTWRVTGDQVNDYVRAQNLSPDITVYTSGSGTYSWPSGALYLRVRMSGGGGGGSGGELQAEVMARQVLQAHSIVLHGGAPGLWSTYGGAGGAGDPGTWDGFGQNGAYGGGVFYSSSAGIFNFPGAPGGNSAMGAGGNGTAPGNNGVAGTNGGGGQGGSGLSNANQYYGCGGGGGGYVEFWVTTPDSYSYSVGAGGTGGNAGANGFGGGGGGDGIIIIEAFYQ